MYVRTTFVTTNLEMLSLKYEILFFLEILFFFEFYGLLKSFLYS